MSVVALVVDRLVDRPGEIADVDGEPLLVHAIAGLLNSGFVENVVAVCDVSTVDSRVRAIADERVLVRERGVDTESVRAAAVAACDVAGNRGGDLANAAVDAVLVHDAASAFAPASVIESVVRGLSAAPIVVPAQPMTDTVKRVDAAGLITGTVDRSVLRMLQWPRGFRRAALRGILDRGRSPFDVDAFAGIDVRPVAGHPLAAPMRTRFDVAVMAALRSELAR